MQFNNKVCLIVLVCFLSVVVAQAQAPTILFVRNDWDELRQVVIEHQTVLQECNQLKVNIEMVRRADGLVEPALVTSYEQCTSFLVVLEGAMNRLVTSIIATRSSIIVI